MSLSPAATHALVASLEPDTQPHPKLSAVKSPAINPTLYPWADNEYGYSILQSGAPGPFYCVTKGKRVGIFSSW